MSSSRRASFHAVHDLRRSPRRRTKTPSVNELSKKCKISPRGKRRLEFKQERPFKGQTFYLDLKGYKKANSLQARIKELGGTIEEFFRKDISCVVTTSKDIDARCSPRSNSTPSPILSVPSPFHGNAKSSSAKGSAVPSPLSADSCGAEQPRPVAHKHDKRGKALVAQAALTYKGCSNITANARNWGVTIWSVEQMEAKVAKYQSVEKKPTSKPLVSGRVAKQAVKPKVRKLRAPFIKVEDHSRGYKPLVHELKEWPKIYFDGPLGSCPFDSPKKDVENECQEQAKTKRKVTPEDKNKKKGFCECCCMHYEDLDMHLLSDRHQSFARDSSNYRSLDELINKGPSLQDFLAKMLLKHEQKEKEELEKDRSESSSSTNSLLDQEKTPTKKNREETLPNCQTPPNQTPEENAEFHTPTNPTRERISTSRTPSTDSSLEKKSASDDTLTRVLRRRSSPAACEAKMVESRQLRSSPRLSDSSIEKKSPGKGGVIEEGKGANGKHTKSHSTSSSPVAESLRRSATLSKEKLVHQSPKKKSTEGKKRSPVQAVDKKRTDLRARTCQQDSSEESSGKENHDPESFTIEENVTHSRLRSGAARVPPHPDEENAENNVGVKSQSDAEEEPKEVVQIESPKRASLRSAAKANLSPESTSKKGSKMASPKKMLLLATSKQSVPKQSSQKEHCAVESGVDNVEKVCDQDIEMESPKKKSLRSASKPSRSEHCRENENRVATHEANVPQDQDVEMESPERKSLRSAHAEKVNLPERCCENKYSTAESRKANLQEDSHVTSPKRTSLRSTARTNVSEAQVQEMPEQDIEMESPARRSLRSTAKENIPESRSEDSESKNPESPKTDERKKRMESDLAAKQPMDCSTSEGETKANETSLGDGRDTMDTGHHGNAVRMTRSRIQSAPTSTEQSCSDSDVTEKVTSHVSKTTEEEPVERNIRARKLDTHRGAPLSKAKAGEAAKTVDEHETKQSSKSFSCGPEAVPEVKIKLADCRQLCLTRKRPVLETESDESETESIQMSSGETLSKKSSPTKASSDGQDDEDDNNISSTSTVECCPSPASSEKSGYSDEATSTRRYSLRKRADDDGEDTCPGKRTRSKVKIPDEDSKKNKQNDRQRRKTVPSQFTSVKVKSRSPKQRSQSAISPRREAPKKKLKNTRGLKSPSRNSPRGKAPITEDSTSESDSSSFSGSPQSGPIRETRSMHASMVHSAVRNLEKSAVVDTEDPKETSLLSDSVLSLGDTSTTAVCGSPSRLRPAQYSLSGLNFLEGSPRIKKDFSSVKVLDKRKQRVNVPRLFESDDEEEDFVGFNVPHFDRSFSSEGDLSYQIDSILENMKGDEGQGTIEEEDDDENTTVYDDEKEVIMTEDDGHKTEKESRRANEGQCCEKLVEEDEVIKQTEAVGMTKKRKSNQSDCHEVKRSIWSESQGEMRSTTESSNVVCISDDDDDDFDEDDDVFGAVADSSDGEEEVASPFSISSWGRKRKSEDLLAPEVERPTKRRKSHQVTDTDASSQSSRAETPVKSGANQRVGSYPDNISQKASSLRSRLDELQKSEQIEKDQIQIVSDSLWDSDEPVYQTMEERIKLRRLKNSILKEQETSRRQNRDHRKPNNKKSTVKSKTEVELPQLKTLRKRTLKQVSPIRSSSRLHRNHSTPSPAPSPLATASGKPRRASWIYNVSEFTSPPSAAARFGGNRVICSTPASTVSSSKRTLRSLRHSRVAEDSLHRKTRQRDVFAFDE